MAEAYYVDARPRKWKEVDEAESPAREEKPPNLEFARPLT